MRRLWMTRARAALLSVAAVAALHGAGWAYVTGRMQAEYGAALDGMHQAGWSVVAGAPRRAGWPFSAALQLGTVQVDGAGAGLPVRMAAEQVQIALHALRPGTLHVVPSGAMSVRLGTLPDCRVDAGLLELTTDGTAYDLAARGLSLGVPGGSVTIEGVQAHAAGLAVEASMTGAVPTPSLRLPSAGRLSLDALLTKPWPGGSSPAAQASAWRDAGGAVTVRRIQGQAGELAVDAAGTAGLDGTLQPVLTLTAKVGGYRPALDRLVAAGTVTAPAATAAKAVLGLLSGRDAQAPATVPVRLDGGVLAVAGFPLLRVPPLAWMPQ